MKPPICLRNLQKLLLILILISAFTYAQTDSTQGSQEFDSQLLKLKVPEAFQKSSLKLEIFADSSWQLYQGNEALDFAQSMHILNLSDKIVEYEMHVEKESQYSKDYRSRRVFSLVAAFGGASYLVFIWDKGWLYHIPGYAALAVGGGRWLESRRLEIKMLREQYFIQTLIKPSQLEGLVEDYNFRLYQYLSTAGIQFSDS